ncbi:MAG: hemerythrin family protein [Rhodocyclaceae bacterium]|nr:hemerythrin family protein [Rhodocyclaceae bacterium]
MTVATRTKQPYVVEWRDGFKINVTQVDREHKHLFALVKQLDVTTVDDTLDDLLEYVVTHFSNEQQLMEDSGYPGFADHLKLHEEFSSTVADFLSVSDSWDETRVQELRRFLNKWLIGHIMTHDLRFGNWYREHHGDNAHEPVTARKKVGWFDRLLGRG